ncbi:hypothetical protein, partial [Enterobacter intestinihominis]
WTLDLPAADLAGIADGSAAVNANVSLKSGKPANPGGYVLVEKNVPQFNLNNFGGQQNFNISEQRQALNLNRKLNGPQAGQFKNLNLKRKKKNPNHERCG